MRLEIKLKVLLALIPLLSAVLVGCDYYQTKLDCSDYFEGRDKAGFTTDESGLAKFKKTGSSGIDAPRDNVIQTLGVKESL